MALITCPECKKEISDSASSCPHCGYGLKGNAVNMKTQKKKKRKIGCWGIGAIVVAVLILIGYLSTNLSNSVGEPGYKIENVGYYKDNQTKLRYFTFNVSESDIDYDAIYNHGSKEMHTDGALTVCYYYTGGGAPDITVSNQPLQDATDANPICSVWHYPSGEIKLIKRPEEGW